METLAGYRVVRELGGGGRSDVLLARDAEERVVVVRHLHADFPDWSSVRQIAAARAGECDHLLPLVDVASTPDGRVLLVTPWLAGGTLGELLARRPHLTAGESATVLLAVISAIRALHGAGWSHGRVQPGSILLASDGTPVLAGLGDAAPADETSMGADRDSVADLVERLLDRPGPLPGIVRSGDFAQAEITVSRLAEPARLSLVTPSGSSEEVGGTAGGPADRGELRFEDLVSAEVGGRVGLFGWLGDFPVVPALEDAIGRLRSALAPVRKRIWITAAVAAAALVAVLILVPSPHAVQVASAASDRPDRQAEGDSAGDDVDGPPDSPSPSGAAGDTREPSAVGREPATLALESDDPLVAARALLDLREGCFAAASLSCLDGVDQPGSAAYEMDSATISRIETGAVRPGRIDLGDAPFVQRTGDSALVAGPAVSLLLIRGDAGWRLRDVFDAPAAQS